jgi:hypothetical protein
MMRDIPGSSDEMEIGGRGIGFRGGGSGGRVKIMFVVLSFFSILGKTP